MPIADESDGADVFHRLEHLRNLFVRDFGQLLCGTGAGDHQRKNRRRVGIDFLDHGRQCVLGKVADRRRHLVAHILDGAFDVPLEHECDRDASGSLVGAGAQLVDAVDRVHRLFNRLGNFCFDFFRACAWQRHEDVDDGRVGLGHQVETELPIRKPTGDGDGRRDHDGEDGTIDADAGDDHGCLRPLPRAGAPFLASPFDSTTGTPAASWLRLAVATRSSPLRPSTISTILS